ncbi:DDE superfamily endonuclease [Phytophthora infestans]|uniref:DDE superfamily endonuclease n=1 Tax=Phytophthora infestans TaxID=4787 RepID=A0A833TI67_PHYIN|nr:DDE superfamily endonuclease [Phytophthora infestans]
MNSPKTQAKWREIAVPGLQRSQAHLLSNLPRRAVVTNMHLLYSHILTLLSIFVGLTAPDGLCIHFWKPYEGRRHDTTVLTASGLLNDFNRAIFGDPAYTISDYVETGFRQTVLSTHENVFNKEMSAVQAAVEWNFGLMKRQWPLIDFKTNSPAYQPRWQASASCNTFNNCLCCHRRGNQIIFFFNMDPPSLDEYLSDKLVNISLKDCKKFCFAGFPSICLIKQRVSAKRASSAEESLTEKDLPLDDIIAEIDDFQHAKAIAKDVAASKAKANEKVGEVVRQLVVERRKRSASDVEHGRAGDSPSKPNKCAKIAQVLAGPKQAELAFRRE